MDPYGFRERKLRPDAIIGFVLGVVAAYVIQVSLGFGGGGLFTAVIVIAVGGAWYSFRKVL